jgi:hypothetical protein
MANGFRLSGFYSGGWYAADRPRRLGIVMGSFEQTHLVTTLQYLKATESPNPIAPRDIPRSGASGFIEIRQGIQGWAGLARVDHFDPDRALANSSRQRIIAGGAYWFVWPRSRPRCYQRAGALRAPGRAHERESVACPNVRRVLNPTGCCFSPDWDRK